MQLQLFDFEDDAKKKAEAKPKKEKPADSTPPPATPEGANPSGRKPPPPPSFATTNRAYLNELNEPQRTAVETTQGPVMIIAGPGSGKTRVLTYRIAHLVNTGVSPSSILSLTFTNKAAREMKERIRQITHPKAADRIWMGTFHSQFAKLLRINAQHIGFPPDFSIYDATDAKNLVKTIVKEQGLNPDVYTPSLVCGRISNAKNNLIGAQAYFENTSIANADASVGKPHIGRLYLLYVARCRQAGAMDFDDLLLLTYRLLASNAEVREKYGNKFRHILIDEFQDTNMVQYAIVKLLAKTHSNVCVVGDDAQSIYAFRGATIDNILNFERDYPDLKVVKLEQNYRSTQSIVELANEIIGRNRKQIAKQIWTDNEKGGQVRQLNAQNDTDEGKLVADAIMESGLRKHLVYDDFAILYRTNYQSRIFEEALRRKGIPYKVYGGQSFFDRKEVKDLMAYMRLTANPRDEEALRRIVNYPTRGIGNTTLDKLGKIALQNQQALWEAMCNIASHGFSARTVKAVGGFVNMIIQFAGLLDQYDAYEMAQHIGLHTGLLAQLHSDKSVEGLNRYDNIQELLSSIQEFTDERKLVITDEGEREYTLGAYLQEISLFTDLDDGKEDQGGCVKLMTVHSAKGLEFKSVYMVGMEEGLFPSQRAEDDRLQLEEERRLFYVAVTRAEKHLTLSCARSRYRYGNLYECQPSRFLAEIPPGMLQAEGVLQNGNIPKTGSYSAFSEEARSSLSSVRKFAQQGKPSKPVAVPDDFVHDHPAKIQAGMNVLDRRFGYGRVLQIENTGNNRIATIQFDTQGNKRIMLKFAKLKICD